MQQHGGSIVAQIWWEKVNAREKCGKPGGLLASAHDDRSLMHQLLRSIN